MLDGELAVAFCDEAPDALIVVGEDGRIGFVNRRAEEFFGYSRAELIGEPVERLIPERARVIHVAHRAAFGAAPRARSMGEGRTFHALRKDGGCVSVEIGLSSLTTPRGHFVIAAVRDVSDRESMAATRREAEERFRLAFDEAPIGMALVGLDGRFFRVNNRLCEIVGYTREELTALTFQAITHPDDVDLDVALAERLARGEIPRYQLGKRYIRKDGGLVDIMLSGSVVRDRDGAPQYFVAHVEDIGEQKRAEAALRRSEADFRARFDLASDGVFIADLRGRYTDVNSAACSMLGYTREELIGKAIVDLIPPRDVPRLAASREALLRPGTIEVSEWLLRHEDGYYVPAEVSAKILPDGRWQGLVRDITERERGEEALRRSEESLRRAQRVAHVGSWDWDLVTDEIRRSDELYALFDVEPGPEHRRPLAMMEHVHPDDRDAVRAALDGAIHGHRPYSIEHRLRLDDGRERYVVQQAEPIVENGRAVRFVGTMLDITERKAAEEAVRAALDRLRTVLALAPVGIIILRGRNAEELLANERARVLFGQSPEQAGGVEAFGAQVLTADAKPIPFDELPAVRALWRGERTRGLEMLVQNPQRGLVPILVNAAPIEHTPLEPTEAVVAFEDISALKELERLRAEWSSLIAHDLRQPIQSIALNARIVAEATTAPALHERVHQITRAVERLDRMIEDLLDFSRLEAQKLRLQNVSTALRSLVDESVDRARLAAPDREVTLEVRGEIQPIEADPVRIAQVMDNLLSNAIKYGTPGTPIAVEVRASAERVTVAVTNEGSDIAPDDLAGLFQRFARTEAAKESAIKGLGLGLYITRALVEAHGGTIEAESGGGRTTFRFSLPVRRST